MRFVCEILLAACVTAALVAPARGQGGARPPASGRQAAGVTAQGEIDEDEVIRVATTLVTIPVTVSDRDGKYIEKLRQEDFRVVEDGVEQQVSFFSSTEEPLSIILLLDTSASTELHLDLIQDAASAFVAQMRPDDRVLPVSFDGRVRPLIAKATGDRVLLQVALRNMRTDARDGGTRLYDAVDAALNSLKNVSGRKAVLLFTDGEDTGSRAARDKTLAKAAEVEALCYSVYLDTTAAYKHLPALNGNAEVIRYSAPSAAYLRALAKRTGARSHEARSLDALKEAFAAVAQELRYQYHVGYYPRPPAGVGVARPRQAEIKVLRPNLTARGRKTFILAPPNAQ